MSTESIEVPTALTVVQIVDGEHYAGTATINGTKFDYDFVFVVPIPNLHTLGSEIQKKDFRNIFKLSLKKDEVPIELNDDEYELFFLLIAGFVVNFYGQPKTRNLNQSVLNKIFGPLSIAIYRTGPCRLTPEKCRLLSVPKFGCTFPAP